MKRDFNFSIAGSEKYCSNGFERQGKLNINYHEEQNESEQRGLNFSLEGSDRLSLNGYERHGKLDINYHEETNNSKQRAIVDECLSNSIKNISENELKRRATANGESHTFAFHKDPRATFEPFFNSFDPSETKSVTVPPIEHDIYVNLEEIDKGCVKKMKITRLALQPNGSRVKEDIVLNVVIEPGLKAGTKIIFPREGDQKLGRIAADIVFIVRDKPHPLFKREGNDLKYSAKISLKQALCGCVVKVPTLSGEQLTISTKNEVIKPNYTKRIQEKGLPFHKEPSRRGDLLVVFDLEHPDGEFGGGNSGGESYTYGGDPRATFAHFFCSSNPFGVFSGNNAQRMNDNGSGDGFTQMGGQHMDRHPEVTENSDRWSIQSKVLMAMFILLGLKEILNLYFYF